MKAGRIAAMIVGVILVLLGIIWALQGLNIIKYGSLMVGHLRWVPIGALVAAAGIGLILFSRRRRS